MSGELSNCVSDMGSFKLVTVENVNSVFTFSIVGLRKEISKTLLLFSKRSQP